MSSGRPQKRRRARKEEEEIDRKDAISERLRNLIERLGEQSKSSTQDNIHGVAGVLVNDMGEFSDLIISTIVTCAATKPERTSIYTTLVGLLNATSFDSGKEIIQQLCTKLQTSLETLDFAAAGSLVRFLSDLGNASVLLPASLVELLQALVNVTTEKDIPQSRSDAYTSMVLGVMPWVGRDLAERSTEAFNALLSSIEEYLKVRSTSHVEPLSVYHSSDVPQQQDSLELLWQQVTSLHRREWKENTVERPYIYFDETLVNSLQHSLPTVTVPEHKPRTDADSATYPMPPVSFRLYGISDVPEDVGLPPSRAVERYLYETTVREMLYTYYPDVVAISRQYAELINNKRTTPFNYIIVEVLFGEMFRLPTPRASLVYYFAILAELVRIYVPFAEVLALGMNHVFQRMQHMDVECSVRYTKWVAHFLNYYGFKFRWSDWFDVVTVEDDMPQSVFVKEALAAMVRLSYHDKIVEEIPAQLQAFMPSKPDPMFKYGSVTDDVKASLKIDELAPLIKQKNSTAADVTTMLSKIELPKSLAELEEEDGMGPEDRLKELQLDVYANCMLQIGSKTISHMGIVFNRQLSALQDICATPETKGQLVRVTADFWQNNSQMILIAFDKLLTQQIVDTSSIVEWVFSPRTVEMFSRHYIWDSLFNMLDFCEQEAAKARAQLAQEKEDLERLTTENQNNDDATAAGFLSAQDATVERCREVYFQKQQLCKDTILMVFQHFSAVLNERLAQREDEVWIATASARFLQIGRRYLKLLRVNNTFDNITKAIEDDLHTDVAALLEQIRVLYAM